MHHLEKSQLQSLLATVPAKHRLMLLVGFWHGLRISELINLRAKDIQDGYLVVQRLKGSKKTVQPWVFNTDPMLSEYEGLKELAKLPLDMVLFPMTRDGVLKLMKRNGKRAGVPRHLCRPHVLKHSIAMFMIKNKPINEVQVYLGHKSIASTGAYLTASEDEAARGVGALI